jgi:exosortase/archaeosortase family protein
MCGIFFGEFFRLRVGARILVLAIALGSALMANLLRTVFLCYAVAKNGLDAGLAWHDTAGVFTLFLCFGITAISARVFRQGGMEGIMNAQTPTRGFFSGKVAVVFVAWLVFVEAGSRLWFLLHERNSVAPAFAEIQIAGSDPQEQKIPERTQAILRYNRGSLHIKNESDGARWWIYQLDWDAGSVGTPLARYHSPEICLPAGGFRLVERRPDLQAGAEGNLRFQVSAYELLGRRIYVFSSYQSSREQGLIRRFDEFDLTWGKRLAAAASGLRPGAQRVIEVVMSGVASAESAEARFRGFVRKAERG